MILIHWLLQVAQMQNGWSTAVNMCIYCRADENTSGQLTREHIVPFSFGGNLVLQKASCPSCAKITRDFEHTCSRKMFGKLRILFGLPTRHKSERPTELPLDIEIDGEIQQILISTSDYPAVPIFFPIFSMPGILEGRALSDNFGDAKCVQVITHVPDNEDRLKRVMERVRASCTIITSGETPIGPFAKLLAKIAHSAAVAAFGIDGFIPFLPDGILGNNTLLSHFIGTCNTPPELVSSRFADGTHRFWFGICSKSMRVEKRPEIEIRMAAGQPLLITLIRLFKELGGPTYIAVTGIPSGKTIQYLEDLSLQLVPLY